MLKGSLATNTDYRNNAMLVKRPLLKWLIPGLRIKRWLLLGLFGFMLISLGVTQLVFTIKGDEPLSPLLHTLTLHFLPPIARVLTVGIVGIGAIGIAMRELNRSILVPLLAVRSEPLIDVVSAHNRRRRGIKVAALGGGHGLPAVLRSLKTHTNNITAIVTVADDGGSSGRLRRELGVLPPGDLRNNIAALANDEALMTQLFQYRFGTGGLEGHSFGNLLITALASITGSMETALIEAGRVLAIEGRVLPSTLHDVTLMAEVRSPDGTGLRRVTGESSIPQSGGIIERVFLQPESARAYPETIRTILGAELIVFGPGSLYTSILPSLLVSGIPEAIRASNALCIYVCNIATQPGETENFTVADHVRAIERHIGRGVIDVVLCNNVYPPLPPDSNTRYVQFTDEDRTALQRYDLQAADLTNDEAPWRHDSVKLAQEIFGILAANRATPIETVEAG